MSGSVIQQNFETMSSRVQKAEKIIGATDASGELTYLIKWEGNDNLELILAKEANLMCPQIVINFHQQRLKCNTEAGPSKVKRRFQKKIKSDLSSTINKIAEKIMSATDASGELTYLIKWEGNDNLEFISVEDANLICPQILIKFFEERLTWSGSNKNGV